MHPIFFSGWDSLLRTLVVGVLAYAALVVILRASGNRTLSKMNAFDFVVTIALGSTLATVLLSKSVALAEGVFALALLVALQFAVTWSSVRAGWVRRLVTGEAVRPGPGQQPRRRQAAGTGWRALVIAGLSAAIQPSTGSTSSGKP